MPVRRPPTSRTWPTRSRWKPKAWRPRSAGSSATCRRHSACALANGRLIAILRTAGSPAPEPCQLRYLRLTSRCLLDAFRQFLADDGWASASHIALSTLMALFPFLIVCTALAGVFFGSNELADEAARILLETWPAQVAGPVAAAVRGVLVGSRGNVLTFGVLFAVYFASSGVESLRVALNRAYSMPA